MNVFNYIKNRVPILDVISQYCTLKKAGSYWKGTCPFHHEKTASFTASPHREIFYCFGCHAGGDVITFISLLERCTQLEAVNFLMERYNIDIPKELLQNNNAPQRSAKKLYEEQCSVLAEWFHQQLLQNKEALSYLQSRGVTQQAITRFMLGYFPPHSIKTFIDYARSHGIMLENLQDLSIVLSGKHGNYSPYEDRILFPITDQLGRTVAFGGRIFKPHDERAKYYNSHEHEYFNKSAIVYGLSHAKETIKKTSSFILVEGYMDVIAMHQAGYTNTVATLGTACTQEHLNMLNRYAEKAYIVYDSDKAGKQAVMRLTKLALATSLEVFVLKLPINHDPASYLLENSSLTVFFDQAQEIMSYCISERGNEFYKKPINERLEIVDEYLMLLYELQDPLKQNMLLQKASSIFQIPLEMLITRIKKAGKASGNVTIETPKAVLSKLEKKIFSVILKGKSTVSQEDEQFLTSRCSLSLKDLLASMKSYVDEKGVFDLQGFISDSDDESKQLISQLLVEGDEEESSEQLHILIGQFQKKQWKLMVNDVKIELAQNRTAQNNEVLQKKLTELQMLQKTLMQRGLI